MEAAHPNYVIGPSVGDRATSGGWNLSRDSYTKLLIHSNTTDESTTFVDSVGTHSPVAGAADVEHDTDQYKWGKSSILFDGDTGYITIPDHADWFMDTGAFTVDFWVAFNSILGQQYFFTQEQGAFDFVLLWFDGTGKIEFRIHDTVMTVQMRENWAPDLTTWYHLAVIRGWGGNANDWAITINGEALTTLTDSSAWPDLAAAFFIGYSSISLDGWIDEFRVSKGIARWTKNFVPPYGPYS